jgi:hypothetical protein
MKYFVSDDLINLVPALDRNLSLQRNCAENISAEYFVSGETLIFPFISSCPTSMAKKTDYAALKQKLSEFLSGFSTVDESGRKHFKYAEQLTNLAHRYMYWSDVYLCTDSILYSLLPTIWGG